MTSTRRSALDAAWPPSLREEPLGGVVDASGRLIRDHGHSRW
jgi:hypothetical protein